MQAKHAAGLHQFGVDGETGKVVDMKDYGLYESAAVKVQTIKTAIEVRRRCVPTLRWVLTLSLAVCMPTTSRGRVRPSAQERQLGARSLIFSRAASSLLAGRRREDREECRTWVEEARREERATWSPRCRNASSKRKKLNPIIVRTAY